MVREARSGERISFPISAVKGIVGVSTRNTCFGLFIFGAISAPLSQFIATTSSKRLKSLRTCVAAQTPRKSVARGGGGVAIKLGAGGVDGRILAMLASTSPFFRALPDRIKNRLAHSISLIELTRGETEQFREGDAYLYFPATCVLSVSVRVPNLPSVFMTFAGANLIVGLRGIISTEALIYGARVVGSGYAYRVPERCFLSMFESAEQFNLFQRKAALTAAELAIIKATCGATHSTAQRLACTLLEACDAFGVGRPITLMQAELARLLSVTRESVGGLLNQWFRAGILMHRRGQISLEHRSGILELSCQCYEATHDLQGRALRRWQEITWR